jgi:2Fe-2S ferredoxin
MINLIITQANSAQHDVVAQPGQTLLQAIQMAGIDGLVAECGGCCVCATCHCFIDEQDINRLAPPSDDEIQMLDFTAAERQPNSRLACQIRLESHHEGLKVCLPGRQY